MLNLRCPICSGAAIKTYDAFAYDCPGELVSVAECGGCQAAWQYASTRTTEESATCFAEQYERTETGTYFDPEVRSQIARMQMNYIGSLKPRRGKLLDIGCGDGTFLRIAAAAGWQAVGVEPARIRNELRENLLADGITVIQGTSDDIPSEMRFDLITLWDVLEHVGNPIDLLRALYDKLADDGIIIIETGNYNCSSRVEFPREWWGFQVDHRWYFSPQVLQKVLSTVGFRDFKFADRVFRPWWKGEETYAGPSAVQLLKQIVKTPLNLRGAIQKFYALRRLSHSHAIGSGLDIFTIVGSR